MGPDAATTAEAVHTLIIGAGPGGLTAAYRLSGAGVPLVVLDRERAAGGLMRSIRRGAFTVDVGRKELYSRIAAVDAFWRELLGDQYRVYPHRFGILYQGHIIEGSTVPRGLRRGMPWGMFAAGVADRLWCRLRYATVRPQTYEEHVYRRSGRRLSRIMAQAFWEKFNARRWADLPPPAATARRSPEALSSTVPTETARMDSGAGGSETIWRHPAYGTGQIVERLEQFIRSRGGKFHLEARVTGMTVVGTTVTAVNVALSEATVTYVPKHVISSLPLDYLASMILSQSELAELEGSAGTAKTSTPGAPRRSTILVYLFLDEPPRFPHAWLEVTDPAMRVGRITNYAGFNGEMVPPGKTALCLEYFCTSADPLLELSVEALFQLAIAECVGARLIDPTKCSDHLVLKLPGADAAVGLGDWRSPRRSYLTRAVRRLRNLYDVNQPGTDHATFAGLEAANAILSGDRTRFDEVTDIDLKVAASPYYQSQPQTR